MAQRYSNRQEIQPDELVQARVRERQWIYLGPIIAAPVSHICVTLYQSAKTPQAKRWLMSVGIIGTTVATISMRLYLMCHAGYPGGANPQAAERVRLVTSLEEKRQIEQPSVQTIVRQALRGFG